MKTWLIGGSIAILVGIGFYLTAKRDPDSTSLEAVPHVAVTTSQALATPEPRTLTQVVDVADLDALLDPPAIPRTDEAAGPMLIQVGFEEPVAAKRSTTDLPPIPKSVD